MKIIFYVFVSLFFSIKLSGQESISIKLDTIKNANYDSLRINQIYEFNYKEFKYLIKNSDKRFKLLYTFAMWCKPCREAFPEILKFANEYKDDIEFYTVLAEKDDKYLKRHKEFFEKENTFNRPIFNISNNYYNRFVKKHVFFVQKLVSGHKDYGLSLVILFDSDNNVLYASTYNKTKEDEIQSLLNFLNKK